MLNVRRVWLFQQASIRCELGDVGDACCHVTCDLSSLLFCGSTMDSLWCFLSVSRCVVNVLLLVTEFLLQSFSIEFSSTMSMCRFCLNISPWSTLPLPMPVLGWIVLPTHHKGYTVALCCGHLSVIPRSIKKCKSEGLKKERINQL